MKFSNTQAVPVLSLLALLVLLATLFSLALGGQQASAEAAKAATAKPVENSIVETIRKRLMAVRPDLVVDTVVHSPIANIYQAQIDGGPVIYTTADGAYFFTGDLYAVGPTQIVNLAELERQDERIELMSGLKADEMIVFSPEIKKATVTVFTDIDCGYCQKLHKEVPALNKLGVEVRYLAYPRAGVGSDSFAKLVTAWCSDDKAAALTKLKNREQLPSKSCANPVAQQFALGQQMGIAGTPAMITADGRLLPGYMPAAALAATLGVQ